MELLGQPREEIASRWLLEKIQAAQIDRKTIRRES
jgi:hypothetical protein